MQLQSCQRVFVSHTARRIVESSEVEILKLLTVHDANNIKEAINLLTLWKQVALGANKWGCAVYFCVPAVYMCFVCVCVCICVCVCV